MALKVVILLSLFLSFDNGEQPEEYNFPFYSDEITIQSFETNGLVSEELSLISDSRGKSLFYVGEIFTEVCETEVCFPVQIDIYWDCSGSFLGFKVPENRPLTKAGHKEFSQFEYFQLYTLLNNPDSKLGKLDKKDLVKHNKSTQNGSDAVTGATIHISNETMVSGAAFTCYTLWNKVDSTRQFITGKLAEKAVISQDDFKAEIANINEIPEEKLALILKIADEQKWLRKLSIQNELVENINTISPLKSLIVSNYLNRQKYLYPEVKEKLDNCRNLQECFGNMIEATLAN